MGFKVVIVGGSVAGLSLANMLERFDIDYVLLEAYPALAPQVGASIGLLPNGLRILDQIGCYEPTLEMVAECRYLLADLRGSGGVLAGERPTVSSSRHLEQRLGYPSFFIDRQMLLQVLHSNIQHKDRLLTKQRVTRVETNDDGVKVYTQDGSEFTGDIVVGADGIHSTVRNEMWRNGGDKCPGYFPDDEDSRIPVSTRCIFGISRRPTTLDAGQHMVHYKGWSYLVITAPGNRTYWFLFDSLPKTLYGRDIPKYSKEDEAELVKKHFNDHITETATFGHIYEDRIMSTLVPLEEYVFERWHFERIITIGDAAHKIDPISGQGGNGAIESAALLTNALVHRLKREHAGLSQKDATEALAEVHDRRYQRACSLVSQAHSLQSFLTQRHQLAGFIAEHFIPLLGPNAFLDVAVPICGAGTKLQGLPVPKRARFVPFEDELPARPIKNSLALQIPKAVASGLLSLALYAAVKKNNLPVSVDAFVSRVLRLGGPLLAGQRAGYGGCIQVFGNLVPALVAWLIESHRCGNRVSVLSWRTSYALAYSLLGIDSILPLLSLSSIWNSTRTIPGRHVPPKFAKSALPAVAVGYILPAISMLLPFKDASSRQLFHALVKTAPISCALLSQNLADVVNWVHGLVCSLKGTETARPAGEETLANIFDDEDVALYEQQDIGPLKFVYASSLVTAAASSLAAIAYIKLAPGSDGAQFGSQVFAGLLPLGPRELMYSNAIYTLASLTSSLYTVWDLRARGFVKNTKAVAAGLASVCATFFFGPAVSFSAICYWREATMAGLSKA